MVHICCKYRTDCKQHALIFACTHFNWSRLLTYYLLNYYFSLWFLLNIFLNNTQFYGSRSKCWQRLCTFGMWHDFSRRAHLCIGPDLKPPNSPDINLVYYKIWAVIQQQVILVVLHKVDKQKLRLLNVWPCMDHFVTYDATIHILVHVCGQMWTLKQYHDNINIFSHMT